jgi:hypothetical protein
MAANYFVRDDAGYCECGNYLMSPKEQNDGKCWGCHQDDVERRQHLDEAGADSDDEAGRRELVRSLRTVWE